MYVMYPISYIEDELRTHACAMNNELFQENEVSSNIGNIGLSLVRLTPKFSLHKNYPSNNAKYLFLEIYPVFEIYISSYSYALTYQFHE